MAKSLQNKPKVIVKVFVLSKFHPLRRGDAALKSPKIDLGVTLELGGTFFLIEEVMKNEILESV